MRGVLAETPLSAAQEWVRHGRRQSRGGGKAAWIAAGILIGAAGVAIAILARSELGDPVVRTLMAAPLDDEPVTEEEEALVAAARSEASIPWAERELAVTE